MTEIIVSYRRSDSEAVAGRIVDRLIAHFGADAVFLDVDNIPFGIDFRDHIQAVFSQAAVMIAIVGPDWLGGSNDRHRRIDDEEDPVRLELEAAFRQKLAIIPVLLSGASMPKANALPKSLRGFAFLNAAPVDTGRDFRPHVSRLIDSIELAMKRRPGDRASGTTPVRIPAGHSGVRRGARYLPIAAAALLLILLGAAAIWRFGPWHAGRTLDPADDNDWSIAQQAGSYDAYASYVSRHPQGRHVADAARAAVAHALQAAPPIGALPTGKTVLIDDHSCGPGEIKAATGGDVIKRIARTQKCVPRDHPF
jgi:Family of unknown function (DUF6719)/TIR domain